MAKRIVDVDKGFDNQDFLKNIREDVLNPIAVRVKTLRDEMGEVKPIAKSAYTHVEENLIDKALTFHSDNGDNRIDLDGMFKEFHGVTAGNNSDPDLTGIEGFHFPNSELSRDIGTDIAKVTYDWDKLVKDNQDRLTVAKTDALVTYEPKAIYFKGDSVKLTDASGIITVEVLDPPSPIMGQINSGSESTVDKIKLTGKTENSDLSGGVLTINLPEGGAGGDDNFKGFYDDLADLQTKVTNPINSKSYAFVRDATLSGGYYTPYFYVNDNWSLFKQDPALLYTPAGASTTKGVFSIKPDPRIKISDTGELDLSSLGIDETKINFHGFFDTQAALEAAVPTPIADKSFAYIKHTNGAWMGKMYRHGTEGGMAWYIMAPLSAFSLVKNATEQGTIPQPFYGIYKNDRWDIDGNGIAAFVEKDTEMDAAVLEPGGQAKTGKFKKLQFMDGESYVTLQNGTLFVNNPQRVIEYDDYFDEENAEDFYQGSLYYDKKNKRWMGRDSTSHTSTVNSWTPVVHRGMSDEVKGLSFRFPWKTPEITPITATEDHARWYNNGFTYLTKGDPNLPDTFRSDAGGWIMTMARHFDKDVDDDDFAKSRFQVCYSDWDVSETYVRRLVVESSGGKLNWTPWLRTSYSKQDMNNHEEDPGAHKSTIKWHKAVAFGANCVKFMEQEGADRLQGELRDDNCTLIVDNYGFTDLSSAAGFTQTPYRGKFVVSGAISFSGYREEEVSTPAVGIWYVVIGKRSEPVSGQPGTFQVLQTFTHQHTGGKKVEFKPMSFRSSEFELDPTDKIYVHIYFSDPAGITKESPNLYFCPGRSYIVIEDSKTLCGSYIAETQRKLYSNVDVAGETGLKIHHNQYDPNKQIRTYGTKVTKNLTAMSTA